MPLDTDRSPQANITRIKFFRNEVYAHVSLTQVGKATFENLWQKNSQAWVDMEIPQKEIDDLKICPVGSKEETYVHYLEEWFVEEEEINDTLLDVQQSVQRLTQFSDEKHNLEKKKRGSYGFLPNFVCGYLSKHAEARHLVTLKEDRFVLRFNDIDKISSIYCDFKAENGKKLKRQLKVRKATYKTIMAKFEKEGLLKKVGSGTEYGKEYLAYKVKNSELWDSLRRNYSFQRSARKIHWYFGDIDNALSSESSSDTEEESVQLRDDEESIERLNSELWQRESTEWWLWEEKSIIHREKFHKLHEYGQDHPQKIKEVNDVRVCFSYEFLIGRGSDATRVYVGLKKDGYERAVKRLPRDDCACLAEQEKKILNEPNTIESNYVLKYRFLDEKSDEDWLFLIMDLCEETLKEFVERSSSDGWSKIARDIIQQVFKGLADLHRDPKRILHRDLKPSNILRNVHDKWLLADFGISRILTQEVSTFRSKERGTKDWRAVESCSSNGTSNNGEVRYKKESDIQVAGMVAFYIVTKGEHPFGEEPDRHRNLLDGNAVFLDKLEDPAAKDLISWMLSHDPKDRPSAEEALKHPYLQSKGQQFEMLCKVGNELEIKTQDVKSDVVRKLNSDPEDWRSLVRADVLKYLSTDSSTGRKIHYTSSWADCLRLIRNVKQHWHDRPRPRPEVFYSVGDPQEYFLNLFPNLPVEVHKIVRSCDWKERPDLKEYFN